ncbi:DUF6895 family protein [Streptomyces sp. 7N604]|uniref:DUF6895 family protein n=1 Tax=Streptomyces sp. 7N604 TaxID=3457415 RepID=UPI003FD52A1C
MRAGRLLCDWLDSHTESFRLSGPKTSTLERLRRLSEFTLVLVGMTRTGGPSAAGRYGAWAQGVANILWRDLHNAEEELREAVTTWSSPQTRALLLAFPALELITGRLFDNHTWMVRAVTTGTRREDHSNVNLAFTRDLAGLHDCHTLALTELERIRSTADPYAVSVQSMYDLTHAIFYATRMGRRRPAWTGDQATWAHQRLEKSGAACLHEHDLDLAAESVMSLLMAGCPVSRYVTDAVHAVAAIAEAEGSIPPHARHHDAASDEFTNRYHATLTGLAALAEYERRSPG